MDDLKTTGLDKGMVILAELRDEWGDFLTSFELDGYEHYEMFKLVGELEGELSREETRELFDLDGYVTVTLGA